jgi:hypothetical protein
MRVHASYDALWVQHPDVEFVTGRPGDLPFGKWRTASMPLPGLLNSRRAPDSPHWKYEEEIDLFRRTDDPDIGYAHGNMDGYWYLNDEFHLESLEFELADPVVEFSIPRLSGPKGDRLLIASWNQIPNSFTVSSKTADNNKRVVWKGGDPWNDLVSLVDGAEGKILRIIAKEKDARYSVRLDGIHFTFDVSKDYARVQFDHSGRIVSPAGGAFGSRGAHHSAFALNQRTEYMTYEARGGILDRDSLRAENRNEDSFGQFRYRNYFGSHSNWTRQTVLTKEGYLIVRDSYEPGENVDGYVAGPCWLLRPEEDWKEDDKPDRGPLRHDPSRNWFDAPAWDHAWWQTKKKRVLLWIDPGEGKTFGVTAHDTSPDISRPLGFEFYPTQNSHAKAVLNAGETEVFLSVLVPFDEGQVADAIAGKIRTSVNAASECKASVGSVTVSVAPDGSWKVMR